jgi:DegV family protein with EDD domain
VFAETYRRLSGEGARAVVSIHLSGDLSGTVEAARIAADSLAGRLDVRVIDSRSLGMGLGFPVIAAAEAVENGADLDQVVDLVDRQSSATAVWFYVDTLDHLRRGGRIGMAQAAVGSALSIKPLLQLKDGRLHPWERVRTRSRALARLEEAVVSHAVTGEYQAAIHHLADAEAARMLADRLRSRLPGLGTIPISEVGAVVGAHVGPGMLGVVLAPANVRSVGAD